ncbi:MAG: replicative DNA helicase [Tissierellia bacterium]|nr:replicative DNA helicase [Tissierellia bacterium]
MDQKIKAEIPQAIEVEKAILGLVITKNSLINILLEKMRSEYFYDPKNKQIFEAISSLNFSNTPVDFATLSEELEKTGGFEAMGGIEYLLSLSDPSYYSANIETYMEIVREKAVLRKLLNFGNDLLFEVYEGKYNSEELIGNASEKLFSMSDFDDSSGLTNISKIVTNTYEHLLEISQNPFDITGISTGFRDLDRYLSGLQNSDFILLAARPSVGKTALGINIAVNAAKAGKKVGVFSLEMSKRQITQRIISMMTMVNLSDIISGRLSDGEWNQLLMKLEDIKNLDLYIDDTASISLTELRAKAKRKKQEEGLDLIMIDYLQLMTTDSTRVENRQQEISTISRGLKALAKELNIPILSLSQLSRKTEERSDKKPMLSDLRESGAIEQDADVVMMLYRDDYYDKESELQNNLEIIIAKHRNGPTGSVNLYFAKEYTLFTDIEYGDQDGH